MFPIYTPPPAIHSMVHEAAFLLVPPSQQENSAPPPSSGPIQFVPPAGPMRLPPPQASQVGGEEPLITVTSDATSINLARTLSGLRARQMAAEKGYTGDPQLRSESFANGTYSAVYGFQGRAGGRASADTGQGGPRDASAPYRPADSDAPPAPRARRGRPSWVLVIPVEQTAAGKVIWGSRESEWSKAWVVPVRQDGMRLVSTQGDADDRDKLPVALLENPDDPRTAQAALALARKYSAPAVAVVLRSQDGAISEWLWRAEGGSSNGDTGGGPTTQAARASGLQLLSSLAAGNSPGGSTQTASDSQEGPMVLPPDSRQTAAAGRRMPYDDGEGDEDGTPRGPAPQRYDSPFPQRTREDVREQAAVQAPGAGAVVSLTQGPEVEGGVSVQIVVEADSQDDLSTARRAIRNMLGLTMRSVQQDPGGFTVTAVWRGGDASRLAASMAAVGLNVSR